MFASKEKVLIICLIRIYNYFKQLLIKFEGAKSKKKKTQEEESCEYEQLKKVLGCTYATEAQRDMQEL